MVHQLLIHPKKVLKSDFYEPKIVKFEGETASSKMNNDMKYHESTYHQSVSRGKNIHVCMKF